MSKSMSPMDGKIADALRTSKKRGLAKELPRAPDMDSLPEGMSILDAEDAKEREARGLTPLSTSPPCLKKFGGALLERRLHERKVEDAKPPEVPTDLWQRIVGPVDARGVPISGAATDKPKKTPVFGDPDFDPVKEGRPSNPAYPVSDTRGRPKAYTEDQVAAALKASRGNVTRAAAVLSQALGVPVHRQTITLYINRSERLQQFVTDVRDVKLDLIEDLVYEKALRGSDSMQKYVLSTQGAERGWGKKTEVTGKGGGKIDVGLNVDLSKMTDSDLASLEKVLALAVTSGA
jgi:hypothetical protein